MKCAKCGYLGFEHADRCRNCGYDFSLASAPGPELSLRSTSAAAEPMDDLSLIDAALAVPGTTGGGELDLDRVFGAPEPASPAPPVRIVREPTLFGAPIPDDEPLIKRASPPRPPLAVRRPTPEVARLRAEQPRVQTLDLALEMASAAPAATVSPAARATGQPWPDAPEPPAEDATVGARAVAMALDLTILAAIDALVIYFTMQICGISLADLNIVPKGPLFAFLFTQNFGYFIAFTAGGQTLGKMAAGIRVVPNESRSSLDVGRACVRSLVWLVLAVPAGLGFTTAFFRRDHRGIHDRFAGTRVVRASA
ncbi:MAG: RDD family protein [Acidobacteriia bacterium]|nr:RDD family protein [Terriglobia bacterium]